MKTEELKNEQEEPQEYTYHRHSEEKSTIYFRCSDKNCKARVLFSKETCKFTMKNKHLSPSSHKQNSRKAITGQQMAKIASLVRGPISLSEITRDTPMLFSPEALTLPEDPDKIFSEMQEMSLVKIFIESMNSAKSLSRDLAKLHFVISVQMFEVNLNDSKKFVIEIESHLSDREKVKKFVVERVGEAKIETFRKI
jgi:hypothetical protein